MEPRKKIVVSMFIALLCAFTLLQSQVGTALAKLQGTPLDTLDIILYFPGILTGNQNIHSPVSNQGGFVGANVILFFTISFHIFSFCAPVRRENSPRSAPTGVWYFVRATFLGASAGLCLVAICSIMGFFFIAPDRLRHIHRGTAVMAGAVIGFLYGSVAGLITAMSQRFGNTYIGTD